MLGDAVQYCFEDGQPNRSHVYLFPALRRIIAPASIHDRRAFVRGACRKCCCAECRRIFARSAWL